MVIMIAADAVEYWFKALSATVFYIERIKNAIRTLEFMLTDSSEKLSDEFQ
jgi:hypothetical protein